MDLYGLKSDQLHFHKLSQNRNGLLFGKFLSFELTNGLEFQLVFSFSY